MALFPLLSSASPANSAAEANSSSYGRSRPSTSAAVRMPTFLRRALDASLSPRYTQLHLARGGGRWTSGGGGGAGGPGGGRGPPRAAARRNRRRRGRGRAGAR